MARRRVAAPKKAAKKAAPKKAVKKRKPKRQPVKDRLRALENVASRFEHWRPAPEVLIRVTAQPTIFPSFDRATRVGGMPHRRVALVHGPSNHGKTAWALGLGLSYLMANHFFAFVDAEYTTPQDWLQKLMAKYAKHPGFVAIRPQSYEETVAAVRDLVNKIAAARNAGDIDPNTTALIVIDSLRKLTPQGLIEKIMKGKDGPDGMKGRGQMFKAALNAQWLDELTPLLYHTNASLLFITREAVNVNQTNTFDVDYTVGGGKAVLYDSSLAVRIVRAGYVQGPKKKVAGLSYEKADVYGEKHTIEIHKTKVGGKEDKKARGFFHTSNGVLVPEGFDRPRDVLVMAKKLGIVKASGSWLTCENTGEQWQGMNNAVVALHEDPATLAIMEKAVREVRVA